MNELIKKLCDEAHEKNISCLACFVDKDGSHINFSGDSFQLGYLSARIKYRLAKHFKKQGGKAHEKFIDGYILALKDLEEEK